MESLKRLEALPASRRSSFIGQAGVLSDLRAMHKGEAFAWLETQLASPISKDWGHLLHALRADTETLERWLAKSKEHALAAADAAAAYAQSGKADSVAAVLPALSSAADTFGGPRLRAALETLAQNINGQGLSPDDPAMARAESLLSGGEGLPPAAKAALAVAPSELVQWAELLHGLDRVYCVAILDWKSSAQERRDALASLPVWAVENAGRQLAVASVDLGSDEIVLVALPPEELREIERLASPLRFTQHAVAA